MNVPVATRTTVKQLPAEADERLLATRLARGEPAAFDEVVRRYGGRVTALAARLLDWADGADDVTQDVFLAVLRNGKTFRGRSRLWTWLAAMTVNRCRSVRRRRWLAKRVLGKLAPLHPQHVEPADRASEQSERAAGIRAAVNGLPATYREVVVLRYFEELSIDEVAEILALRRNTVEVRLTRARKLLEKSLQECGVVGP